MGLLLWGLFAIPLVIYYVRFYWKWRKGPPGPLPMPILGNLIQLGIAGIGVPPNVAISKLTAKYGDIFRLSLGMTDYVVLGSIEVMSDIRNRKEAQGRYNFGIFYDRQCGQNTGIGFSEGRQAEATKKFAFNNLHKLGMRKTSGLEQVIQQYANGIVSDWAEVLASVPEGEKRAVLTGFEEEMGRPAAEVVLRLIMGEKLYDPMFQLKLDKAVECSIEWAKCSVFAAGMDQALPFLGSILPSVVNREVTLNCVRVMRDMAQDLLDDLRRDKTNNSITEENRNSLCYMFLEKIEEGEDEIFTDFHFQTMFLDLFQGAFETQNATILSLLLFSILHPGYQERIWEEVKSTLRGKDEPVSLEHRKRMPFTEAFIWESHRHAQTLSAFIPSKLTEDTTYGNYKIPKGTGLMPDVRSAFMDKRLWPNPHDFEPERFLNEKGQFCQVKRKKCTPFGIGRRSCPGEVVGDSVSFIFFITFLKNFKLSTVPEKPPRKDMHVGITSGPYPFQMYIEKREW